MPQSTIERRVRRAATEAAAALDAADQNGWRVAELTHRHTRGSGRPPRNESSGCSISEWVALVARPRFGTATAKHYRQTWTKYGDHRLYDSQGAERSFGDHLFAVRHPNLIHLLDEAEGSGVSAARLRIREQEDLGNQIDTEGADPVIDSLTDPQVEELTAAAHRRRPRAAQAGAGRATQSRIIPASPTGGGLVDIPGADPASTLWMDADREIGNLHSAITALHRLQALNPEMMAGERADRLDREVELLRMLVEVCRGVSTSDLDEALAAWAGE